MGAISVYTISVPIRVPVSKTKFFYLNLNQYRNAHHFTLSKAKNVFHEIVKPLLGSIPRMERVDLIYELFVGSHQECDTSNVCSIVDKFFSDVLVNCHKIEDDNFKVVLSASYRYGGFDKGNPHVRVTIKPVGPAGLQVDETKDQAEQPQEEKPMQITIRQAEIEAAIRQYVGNSVAVSNGKRIDIKLSAKRGPGGFQAVVDIVDSDTPATTDQGSNTSEGSTQTTSTETVSEKPAKAAPKSSLFGGAGTSAPVNEPEVQSAEA